MPLITESISSLNRQLERKFGTEITGRPIYRIVWAEDQREKRLTDCDDKGNLLLYPEVRELPKYQWVKGKHILEKLMYIDNPAERPGVANKIQSYELIFSFEDKDGNELPPRFDVCELVITTMEAAMKGGGFVKYKEDLSPEAKEHELKKVEEELFGNETKTTDALAYKTGIVNPYEKEN